jgi:hypothetical protein
MKAINNSLPSNKFLCLITKLYHRQSAIIAQLQTGHIPLNQHLFHICCSETPSCPHCGGITVESIHHYLFICPHYQNERHTLHHKLKRKAASLSYLLSNPAATEPLLKFIHAMKRFKTPESPVSARSKRNIIDLLNSIHALRMPT